MAPRKQFAKGEDVRRFRLVSRSARDAHANDPDAPPLVLEPVVRPSDMRRTGLTADELSQPPQALLEAHPEVFADPDAQLPEQPRYMKAGSDDEEEDPEAALEGDCYFPPDGYNYEQHLVTMKKKVEVYQGASSSAEPEIVVADPTGAAAAVVVEATVMPDPESIRRPAPSNDEAAAVLAALDQADAYEELDEDIVDDLLMGGAAEEEDVMIWGPAAENYRNMPDLADFKAAHAARLAAAMAACSLEEGSDPDLPADALAGSGVCTTTVSAAQQAEFEDLMAGEYGSDSDAACEGEEIEGDFDLEDHPEILDEYMEDIKQEQDQWKSICEPIKGKYDNVPRTIEETKALVEKNNYRDVEEGMGPESEEEDEDESKNWDCDTILSTLSNISNRPGKIGKININKIKPIKPIKEEDEGDVGESSEEDGVELPDVVNERERGETSEDRRKRKTAVKELRRICRQMKKETKETYKAEAAKLPANQAGNGDLRQKQRTFKM